MTYRILGLPPGPFAEFAALDDERLAARGGRRYMADAKPGYPCRVSLQDAEPGERVLLLPFEHQPARTPYRASHAIYVRENARIRCDSVDRIPEALRGRTLSLRAFDLEGMMVDADLAEECDVEASIVRLLEQTDVAYLQAHFAKRGCYAARIERAVATPQSLS